MNEFFVRSKIDIRSSSKGWYCFDLKYLLKCQREGHYVGDWLTGVEIMPNSQPFLSRGLELGVLVAGGAEPGLQERIEAKFGKKKCARCLVIS
jgi:hypothetical protein